MEAVNTLQSVKTDKKTAPLVSEKLINYAAAKNSRKWNGKIMKEYELIWEIFNKCPRNQMRDVFVEELELEDPEEYIRNKFKGKEVSYEKTVLEDGTVIFDITTSHIKQRCSFTEI